MRWHPLQFAPVLSLLFASMTVVQTPAATPVRARDLGVPSKGPPRSGARTGVAAGVCTTVMEANNKLRTGANCKGCQRMTHFTSEMNGADQAVDAPDRRAPCTR